MLDIDQFMNIQLLKREGHSVREIARLSGHSRNTVRKVLRARAPRQAAPRQRDSLVDAFKPYLRERYLQHQLSAVRLTQEIRAMGFEGGERIVRRFLAQLRQSTQICKKLTVRFETPPGKQAQCDWTEVGRYPQADGTRLYVYAFVMVLSYSRMCYVEFTLSMRQELLIGAHQRAFEFFGGIPETILYDNMKQIRLHAGQIHPLFGDFAAHYGFGVKCHRPWRPRTKGKVERCAAYVKDSFLRGRHFAGLEDLNAQRWTWMQTANSRIHGTTGKIPAELLAQEGLQGLKDLKPWAGTRTLSRRVNAEAMVQVHGVQYSVPALYCNRRVEVQTHSGNVTICCAGLPIASHPEGSQAAGTGRVESAQHISERWELSRPCSAAQKSTPSRPLCEIDFQTEVQQRPLSVYEQEVQAA
jgi:transposase